MKLTTLAEQAPSRRCPKSSRCCPWTTEPWPGAFTDKGGRVIACIQATEQNREALKEFCARTDLLREKLAEFLRPEVIEENLLRLASCPLLPEVTGKK